MDAGHGPLDHGGRDGAVFASTDRGATFAPWSEGLDGSPVLALQFETEHRGRAWVSTADGSLFTRDGP